MPDITYIVRCRCIDGLIGCRCVDGLIEEQEFSSRIDAETFFDNITCEDNSDVWVSVELVSYDYTHHCETLIADHYY